MGGPLAGRGTEFRAGGAGNTVAAHGGLEPGAGTFTVPQGTTVTQWTADGLGIYNEMGILIQNGDYAAIAASWGTEAEGAVTWLPGAQVPNYTVGPPTGLTIMTNSTWVWRPTPLSNLVRPNMGHLQCAFCLY